MCESGGVLATPELESMLRGASLRVTRPRVAVLSTVHDHPHADTNSVIGLVREQLGEVSQQAVYDVLRALTETGLLRRIQVTGSVARYEARVGDNHHHVVCRACGCIADVDCAVGDTPCLTASDDNGFSIDEAEVVYWGRCPDCQTEPTTESTESTESPKSSILESPASITSTPSSMTSPLRRLSRSIWTISWSLLRAPLMVNPWSYSKSLIRRIISTSWCW